jgi:hypothetical protein
VKGKEVNGMPGFDGTGPAGRGPMTGGGRGWCNPYTPAYTGYGPYPTTHPYSYGPYGAPIAGRPARRYGFPAYGGLPWGYGLGRPRWGLLGFWGRGMGWGGRGRRRWW